MSFVRNQNLKGTASTSALHYGSIEASTAGYAVGAAVGFKAWEFMDFDLRPEFALDYRQSDIDGMNVTIPGQPAQMSEGDGEISLFSAMLNGYIDYNEFADMLLEKIV